jgi:hypothetical protein
MSHLTTQVQRSFQLKSSKWTERWQIDPRWIETRWLSAGVLSAYEIWLWRNFQETDRIKMYCSKGNPVSRSMSLPFYRRFIICLGHVKSNVGGIRTGELGNVWPLGHLILWSKNFSVNATKAPLIFNLSTRWRWVVTFTSWALYSSERNMVPI